LLQNLYALIISFVGVSGCKGGCFWRLLKTLRGTTVTLLTGPMPLVIFDCEGFKRLPPPFKYWLMVGLWTPMTSTSKSANWRHQNVYTISARQSLTSIATSIFELQMSRTSNNYWLLGRIVDSLECLDQLIACIGNGKTSQQRSMEFFKERKK
jgi:hypothetical protein